MSEGNWKHLESLFRTAALALTMITGTAIGTYAQTAAAGGPPRVTIPRLEGAPRVADFDGMEPTGAAVRMAKISGLVDRLPRDGVPVSERTDVYLGYDGAGLYAVFVCFDSDPSQIRAHLNGRDRVTDSEDSVALQIDTFRDRKHAYGFQTNAYGVQQDGIWTEGKGWDLSFDTVWSAETQRTARGYVVLFSVPFKSLRFHRHDVQSWGVLVFRGIARRNEEAFWPPYSTQIAGRMNQAAVMDGLDSVSPGRNVQLVPFLSTRSFRAIEVEPGRGGHFVSDLAQAEIGVDAKLVVKDSVSIDLTANPDFSQVESDEPQVTVNRRFETFFPEKRPFFLENASYFDTPIPLLFTRRILNPDAGGRLTGRVGRYSFGVLAGVDRPGTGSATIGVLRVNRDIGTQSSFGVFSSSRVDENFFNRVGGVDSRFKLGSRWFATMQAVVTATRGPDGRQMTGSALRGGVTRTGRSLTYSADFNDRSAGFRTGLGFIDRTDIRSLDQALSYRWMPAGSRLLSWGLDLSVSEVRDHNNNALDRTLAPKLSFEWPRLTKLSVTRQEARVRLRPEEVESLDERMPFSQDETVVEFGTSVSPSVTLSLKAATGDGINLIPRGHARPSAGRLSDLTIGSELRPSAHMNLATTYLLASLRDGADRRVFRNQISRVRLNHQFTRKFAGRAIVQYESLAVDPALTALDSRRNLNFDLLFSYVRTPGTALYVGYNTNFQNFDPALRPGPNGLLRSPHGLLSDGRQLFVKASYLLRK